MAQTTALNDILWLTDSDGTPIDFGGPYLARFPEGWWTAVFEGQWTVSLLPPSSSTSWERALDAVDGDLVARDPVGLISAARSDEDVPLPWLPYLAEERSVDEFSSAWPEARQRAVTAASLPLHQVKGTRPALDRALEPLQYTATVVEWFEVLPTREPNTFRVALEIEGDRSWVGIDRAEIIRTANGAKNAHTKLEALQIKRRHGPAVLHTGGVPRRRHVIRVGQVAQPTNIRLNSMIFVGAVSTRRRTVRVGPRP